MDNFLVYLRSMCYLGHIYTEVLPWVVRLLGTSGLSEIQIELSVPYLIWQEN